MTPSPSEHIFADREDAARLLAERLHRYQNDPDVVIYALPRGGVVMGRIIADALHAPLDLIITRKIGHPSFPEYAIGAVAEDGHLVANAPEISSADQSWLNDEILSQRNEAKRRRAMYTKGLPAIDARHKTAIIVDDGIATGLTMRCAIGELKHRDPQKIIVAVPVASPESIAIIKPLVDDIICINIPKHLGAIGEYYASFPQVEDAKVINLMHLS